MRSISSAAPASRPSPARPKATLPAALPTGSPMNLPEPIDLPEIAISLRRLDHGEDLPLPVYASAGAAGMDVVAAESLTLAPGARHAVATGFAIAIPEGFEVQVRPRSGLAL